MADSGFAESFTRTEKIKGAVLFFVYLFLIVFGGSLIERTGIGFLTENLTFVAYLILFTLAVAMFFPVLKASFKNVNEKGFTRLAVIGLITLVLIVASGIFLHKMGISNENNETANETAERTGVFMFVSAAVFAPFAEELIYRFFIFRLIGSKNLILAHNVTAAVFGFSHVWGFVLVDGDITQLAAMLPTFCMSLGSSVLYQKTGTLAYPIILHMVINIIAST